MEKIKSTYRLLTRENRIYFTKQTERKLFFILTILMLVYGVFAKNGYY